MEPLVYVMAIMSCADSGTLCAEERLVEQRYLSAVECNAAAEAQLILNSDIDAPVLTAMCRRTTAQWAEANLPKAAIRR